MTKIQLKAISSVAEFGGLGVTALGMLLNWVLASKWKWAGNAFVFFGLVLSGIGSYSGRALDAINAQERAGERRKDNADNSADHNRLASGIKAAESRPAKWS